MNKIKVLSYFDGMSCGRIALDVAEISVESYFASEIDKNSIAVSKYNYPDIEHIGDVKNVNLADFKDIDLLIGGSPCQSFSIGNVKRDSFQSDNGKLFFYYLQAKDELKPKHFLYENVATMCKADKDFISSQLGVQPYEINSNIASAQMRNRYYWTNLTFDFETFEYKYETLADIVEIQHNCKNHIDIAIFDQLDKKINKDKANRIGYVKNLNRGNRIYSIEGKSICLTKSGGGLGSKTGLYLINGQVRKLTPNECEQLQTVPRNYTKKGLFNGNIKELSDAQRINMLGNGWTVDIIAHFFKQIKREYES